MGFESPSRHFNELRVSHKTNDFFSSKDDGAWRFLSHQYNLVRDIQAFLTLKVAP